MEVHKHPHNVTHTKKWIEYLLEFFMLFLAVFLGFIAENIREGFVDKEREKKYIHAIIGDIKSDTAQSDIVLAKLEVKIAGIDSVMDALLSSEINNNSNNAYHLWSKNLGFADFVYNDGTIQQLKNNGGLSLIKNKSVADSIMKYDRIVRYFYIQADLMNTTLADQHVYEQLFDFAGLIKSENTPVPLTDQGRRLLNEAYANRRIWKYALYGLIERLQAVHDEGKKVLRFITEQYNLE